MPRLTRRCALPLLTAAPLGLRAFAQDASDWLPLFDDRSLAGWKAGQHSNSFRVGDGQIAAHGAQDYLFYTGPARNADFKNFELYCEAKLGPGAQSGLYFHTPFQSAGEPRRGFRILLANTYRGPGGYIENRKTGSLFGVRNVYKQFAPDGAWFTIRLTVRERNIQVRLNDMLVVDYIEPDPPVQGDAHFDRVLSHGTFAVQSHGPESAAYFRNLRVRPMPDVLPQLSEALNVPVDDVYRQIIRLSNTNIPLVDSHTHLKGGLTLDQALNNSHRVGIFYGIAINCGLSFPVHDDDSVRQYLETMKNQPCYVAMQAEGREWRTCVSRDVAAKFDYIFTDAMTFSDDNGKRMRIWIPEEIGVIHDKQAFMEMLVNRIEHILREPVDIYANPTYIPDQIAADYDALWTPARMDRVIHAALENNVAIEINNRRRIPSLTFLKRARAAGCKFSFGTNNAEAELGRLEYPMQMVDECGLTWDDMFVPQAEGKKAIQVKS